MPPFLPVMGLDRTFSQRARVGGAELRFGTVSYIDLGKLSSPTGLAGTTGEGAGTLAQNTNYNYVVTATDAYGGETTPSVEVTVKTANVAGVNENKLTWNAVAGATGYNVYRAKNESGKEVLVAEVTEAKYTDLGAAAKTATPPSANNTYVNNGKNYRSPISELKSHSAVGAFEVVGPITGSNLDWVPVNEAAAWELTLESEKAKVKEAKEVRQRSTATFRSVGPATASITGIVSEASKEKLVAVVYNVLTNVVEGVVGANETTASVSTLLEKVTANQQLLYLLNTKGTTKTVTNVTSALPNPPVIARV